MRRVLEVVSALLFLAGLELAAGTLSGTVSRIEQTLRITFGGTSFVAPAPEFGVGLVLIVFGGFVWILAIWANRQSKTIQAGPNCPRCSSETSRLKRTALDKLLAALLGFRVTRRRCEQCSWGGLSLKQ